MSTTSGTASSASSSPGPVSLGTPLTPGATRVLLLGSGELGKEVAIELQRLGAEELGLPTSAPGSPGWVIARCVRRWDRQEQRGRSR